MTNLSTSLNIQFPVNSASPFTNTLCCKQLKYNNMKQSNMQISPVHPHFHTPALLWGGGVRKGQSITGQPRSLKINNGWYCWVSVPFTASAPFITVCAAQSRLHIEGIHKILKTVNGWSLLAYKTHVCVFAICWLCFCDTTLSVFWVSLLSSVFFFPSSDVLAQRVLSRHASS